jgi:cell division protein FtsB
MVFVRLMMTNLAQKAQFFSRANRQTLLIFCGLTMVLLGYTAFREFGILQTWRLNRAHVKIESDNQRLREENALMKREVEDLKTNRSRIEMEARKLGFVYPDEIAVYWKRDNGTTDRMFVRPANSGRPLPMCDREK